MYRMGKPCQWSLIVSLLNIQNRIKLKSLDNRYIDISD